MVLTQAVVDDISSIMSGFGSSDDEPEELNLTPFEIGWFDVDLEGCDEKLGISGLPGCRFKDTWRSLTHDIKCIKEAGVHEVFSLCTKGELNKYRNPWLLQELSGADFTVHHYPFPDGCVPSMASLMKMVDEIHICLQNERKPLVHCFGGLGRSCLVAACVLLVLDGGIDVEAAIAKVRQLRGHGAIQSVKQYNFVSDFRALYEDYKKDQDGERRSVSR